MPPAALPHLSDADLSHLIDRAETRAHSSGDVLIEEGDRHGELLFVRSGRVRIERHNGGQSLTYGILGAGEVLGEMALLEDLPASARVVADTEVVVAVVRQHDLDQLLTHDPSFAARFYRSLAVAGSRRLRVANLRIARLVSRDSSETTTRKVAASERRDTPMELKEELRSFRRDLAEVEHRCHSHDLRPEDASMQVRSIADDFMNTLTARSREVSAQSLSGAFLEVFPELMRSATISACYARPGGYPADAESLSLVHQKRPLGDGDLGRWVDAWFLGRPLCRGIRDGDRLLGRLVQNVASRSDRARVFVISALAGHSVFADQDGDVPRLSVIDPDEWALARVAREAEATGMGRHLTLIHQDFERVVAGTARVSIGPQQLIASLRLADFAEDDQLVRALDWIWAHLESGGVAMLASFLRDHPDRLVVEHLLDWPMQFRNEGDLRVLVARSAFRDSPIQIELDRTGSRAFVILQR